MTVPPTLDGSATGISGGSSPLVATLTTTLANDVIVVVAMGEQSGGGPALASVTAPGLSFAQRVRSNASGRTSLEVWWAIAAAPLSAVAITATFVAAVDDAAMAVFGVNGCDLTSPWDSNTSLPAKQSFTAPAAISFSGISTSQPHDLLLAMVANSSPSLGTAPTGFARLASALNGGGAQWGYACVDTMAVSTPEVSATFTWQAGISVGGASGAEAIFDALTADAGISVSPAVGTAAGTSTALGVSSSTTTVTAIGTASGTSTALAVGSGVRNAVGVASGTSTAPAVGTTISSHGGLMLSIIV